MRKVNLWKVSWVVCMAFDLIGILMTANSDCNEPFGRIGFIVCLIGVIGGGFPFMHYFGNADFDDTSWHDEPKPDYSNIPYSDLCVAIMKADLHKLSDKQLDDLDSLLRSKRIDVTMEMNDRFAEAYRQTKEEDIKTN